jgi:hypothetical protein
MRCMTADGSIDTKCTPCRRDSIVSKIPASMGVQEKQPAGDSKSGDSSPSPQSDIEVGSVGIVEETSKDGDEALRFLKNQHAVGEMTAEDERKLVRKIDWMIMPLMWSCYCLQYLDKTLGKNEVHIMN